jgi:hypothetical protein
MTDQKPLTDEIWQREYVNDHIRQAALRTAVAAL